MPKNTWLQVIWLLVMSIVHVWFHARPSLSVSRSDIRRMSRVEKYKSDAAQSGIGMAVSGLGPVLPSSETGETDALWQLFAYTVNCFVINWKILIAFGSEPCDGRRRWLWKPVTSRALRALVAMAPGFWYLYFEDAGDVQLWRWFFKVTEKGFFDWLVWLCVRYTDCEVCVVLDSDMWLV